MFRIFTDQCANLPPQLADQYELGVLPMACVAGGTLQNVSSGFDGGRYYALLRAGAETKTAGPSMELLLRSFSQVLRQGEDLLYICVSGALSGTAALAKSVAAELRGRFPERKITVLDSRAASLGEGLCALYAAYLRIQEGQSYDEVVRRTEESRDTLWQVFTVDDPEFLRRGERVRGLGARLGDLLNVKPILMGDAQGRIVLRQMNLGRRRSLDTLAGQYKEHCADKTAPVGLAHGDCAKDAAYLEKLLRSAGCTGEILTEMCEPVTGAHLGPGAVVLFFSGPRP